MSLSAALELASKGFHVFPLVANSKTPVDFMEGYPTRATRDPEQLTKWWTDPVLGWEQPFNVGISTSRFGDNEALVVVDVDNKGEKNGDQTCLRLEMEGLEFPITTQQLTPTRGRHLIYRFERAVKQGVNVLGSGIDIRSSGGYIVGAGSTLENQPYTFVGESPTRCPAWIVERCGATVEKTGRSRIAAAESPESLDRATEYLVKFAPISVKGRGGDQTAYKVAARVKDFGVSAANCLELMLKHWNQRCPPGWSYERLQQKVEHAYRYGANDVGADSPENVFAALPAAILPMVPDAPDAPKETEAHHPFTRLNAEYAYILSGGHDHILRETKDHKGNFHLQHLDIEAFHRKTAATTMSFSGKTVPVSKLWITSSDRRSYDGLCFIPGREIAPNFYNLWRGFSVEPLDREPTEREQASLDAFLEHAKQNVCLNDESLNEWLISYFAQLVQRPWEKPLVALVMKGKKGVGKNALIERVGYLLGDSFAVVSNRRYLTGNFNSLLENKLLLTLDEAFWSGDKAAEGVLKDLITGEYHRIERKGKEPYRVENCLRVAILGNEDWLIPASEDERRFAVFTVGNGRKQDVKFFKEMREGMEAGGYRLLLKYLLNYEVKVDVSIAPKTQGLADQKQLSGKPLHHWWHECLLNGRIMNQAVGWQDEVETFSFRDAFYQYLKTRDVSGWKPDSAAVGRMLKECLPKLSSVQKRSDSGHVRVYKIGSLEHARRAWDEFIGHPTEWDAETLTESELFS